MKYFNLSKNGMNEYVRTEISNSNDVFKCIQEKKENSHWHLSVNYKDVLSCNPSAPLYIYGAKMSYIIVDEGNNVLYNYWKDSLLCENITNQFLTNCK